MKYRIYKRWNQIIMQDGMRFTEVFEIQRLRWWGWQYVESWAVRELAEARIIDLTDQDPPTTLFERFVSWALGVVVVVTKRVSGR